MRYIEATREDIAVADRLCREVLSSTLDQLPPKTRELLRRLGEFVSEQAAALGIERADVRFTRREVRERTQLGNTQLKLHLGRLLEMEYLELHRERHGQRFAYSLAAGLEGAGEVISAAEGTLATDAEPGIENAAREYHAKPVGGGRGAVGGESRPVIMSDYGEMRGVVGVEREITTRPKMNGSSYAPLVKAAHPLAAVAAPAAAPAE